MNQRGFVIPSFFLSPTGIMAAVIAALALTNFITYKLWRSEVAEYAQFRTDVETQSALLRAEAERDKAESERVSADAARGWIASVEYWKSRADRIVTVRLPASCGQGTLPIVSEPAARTEPAVEESRPSASVDVAECEARLNEAIKDAAQLEHLRRWVADQREVGK